MTVLTIETICLTLAFDLSRSDFRIVMDRDHYDDPTWAISLYYKLLAMQRVIEVDYDGMFVRHAIFVDIEMSEHLEQDKKDITAIIEEFIS